MYVLKKQLAIRESEWCPLVNHRIDSNDVKLLLKNNGFKDISDIELNEHFYIVMANL
jgi:hypothetical protein